MRHKPEKRADERAKACRTGGMAAVALASAALAWVPAASAAEFRTIRPVAGPQMAARPGRVFAPLGPQTVASAVEKLAAAWNDAALEQHLGQDFYDRTRLLDAMSEKVPRDARLRVLGTLGAQTLDQQWVSDASGKGRALVSTVAVTVRTQVEFNDPRSGFQRREGTNELLLRITQGPVP